MKKALEKVYMVKCTIEIAMPIFADTAHDASDMARMIAKAELEPHGFIGRIKTVTCKVPEMQKRGGEKW